MANQVVNRQVNVYVSSGEAEKAFDRLKKKEKELTDQLAKATDPKVVARLKDEINKLQEPITRAGKKLRGELLPTIRDLETATKKWLNEFKRTGDPQALANFQKFNAELNNSKQQLKGLADAQEGLTKKGIFSAAFWANLAAGIVQKATSAISGFLRSAIQEALDADTATRRLQSTLDNLGRGDAFDRITRKADEMARRFKFLDNDDVVGVFNKLIDYGKLTEREMNNLLPVIIDFSSKTGTSLQEATSVIIKALEGNGKALKEYGIDIKDAGTETERLNIVMTTLKEKVDGAADAFGESAQGKIATAKQELANLKEEIGTGLIPILVSLLSVVNDAIKGIKFLGQAATDAIQGKSFAFTRARNVVENTASGQQAVEDALRGERAALFTEQRAIDSGKVNKTKAQLKESFIKRTKKRIEELNTLLDELKDSQDVQRLADIMADLNGAEKFLDELTNDSKKPLGIDASSPDKKKGKKKEKINFVTRAFLLTENELSEAEKLIQEQAKRLTDLANDASFKQQRESFLENSKAIISLITNDAIAKRDLEIENARGKQKLALQKKKLSEQEQAEIDALKKEAELRKVSEEQIQNSIALIRKKYRDQQDKLDKDFFVKQIQDVLDFANQALSILSSFSDAQTSKENSELDRDRRINDKKRQNLDSRLRKGTISQQQYDLELQKIERAQDKREREAALKQFKRNQRLSIIQAIINGAQGATKTIAENGFPAAIPFLIAEAIAVGLQIAAINKQKPPEFAKGGKLGGRSHSAGGNDVIDGHGRKIAEVEEGEGVANKHTMAEKRKYTVSGTPSQIISSLNGLYGVQWDSGATLIPHWRKINANRMNFAAVRGMYATGGVIGKSARSSTSEGSDSEVFKNLSAMISDMQSTQALLVSVLSKGIRADVSLKQFQDQQDRVDAIKNDATFK